MKQVAQQFVAHVKQDECSDEWDDPHALDVHLLETAQLAAGFADQIGECWVQHAGRWHDLGKYREKFQDYIRLQSGYELENAHIENGQRAPHSTAGAIHAVKMFPPGIGHILAYLISGQHAGLPDWYGGRASLENRLNSGKDEYHETLQEEIPAEILRCGCPELPQAARSVESISLWIRMLFSCLVDADFLDTERYMQPDKSKQRVSTISIELLHGRFSKAMIDLQSESQKSEINDIRNQVLSECYSAAKETPGLFSLTVPTGGGKTLSSLAFALEHTRIYGKKRIIYAIPFTSIIEQNADVFRQFLGQDAVLEHHSTLDVKPSRENSRARLAAENWDAPLIVTTNVQLFESLHASRTSRCRKLHNLVNSVIILDEAQQIPRDFHAPITHMMRQMSDHFGVTWVLCTATQPELKESKNTFGQILLKGLKDVREIISQPLELASKLERVEIQLPAADESRLSWQEVAQKLQSEDCVLAIVNTRKNARELCELLPDEDGSRLHLSAHMCAAHRTQVLNEIKKRLKRQREGYVSPLRVVSTQLIEAGVDVDFPVVYRAMAGLDSIAQSAGRCNREGNLKLGKVFVFRPERPSPAGYLKQGEEITEELIAAKLLGSPLAPESFEQYFSRMNARGDRDKHQILDLLEMKTSTDAPLAIQFREAAKKFRLIDDTGESIIVPFVPEDESESPVVSWIRQLERGPSQKWIYRKLQRYTVSIPERLANQFQSLGAIENRAGLRILLDCYYHAIWGVDVPERMLTPGESVY